MTGEEIHKQAEEDFNKGKLKNRYILRIGNSLLRLSFKTKHDAVEFFEWNSGMRIADTQYEVARF